MEDQKIKVDKTKAGMDKKDKAMLWHMLSLSMQLGVAVAVPTAALGWGGHLLDIKYGTGSKLLFAGLALALILSMLFVYKIVRIAQERLLNN